MKTIRPTPPQEVLKELFDYNPETGQLTNKTNRNSRCRAGKEAGGFTSNGYRVVTVQGESFLSHKLIWKWVTGYDSQKEIDHANRDPADNRWVNLREATRSQQTANRELPTKHSYRGVTRSRSKKNPYMARLRAAGKCGVFKTAEEAAAQWNEWAREQWGEFAYQNALGR